MSDPERLNDAQLVAAYRAADRDAFAAIYDRHASTLFTAFLAGGLSRVEAADATHDLLLDAASRLHTEEPYEIGDWLLTTAADEGAVEAEALSQEKIVPAPPALRPRVLDKVDRGFEVVSRPSPISPERMRIAVFAFVALVVGLIGFPVSGMFEPHDPPPANPGPVASAETTTTTSIGQNTTQPGDTNTIQRGGTTTTQPDGSTTTTSSAAAATPASLSVDSETVDLGADGSTGQFEIANSGGRSTQWQAEASVDAIDLSTAQGELGGGESETVELSLDREAIEEGEVSESVTLVWDGGEIEIAVAAVHEDNPIIHDPLASPSSVEVSGDPECTNTETTVSARIRDTSPLESAVVQWSPDGSAERETPMEDAGNDMFEAVVGPFTSEQSTTVRVVAFDERGNAGGATTSLSVVACP